VDDRPKKKARRSKKQKLSALPCIYRCVHQVKDVCGCGGDDDDGEEAQEPNYAQPKCKTRIRFFFYPRSTIKSAGGKQKNL
jgi:hypothetical protein